jgi:hypothetical protein
MCNPERKIAMKALDARSNTHWISKALSIAFVLLHGASAVTHNLHAAEVCVLAGDSIGLQTALATLAANSEDNTIKLQAGAYDASGMLLKYLPSAHEHSLVLSGGFHEDADTNDPCGGFRSFDARDTTISGGRLWMNLPDGAGSIALSLFTVTSTFTASGQAPPVDIQDFPNSTGSLAIDRVIFEGMGSPDWHAIYLSTSNGSLSISNSIFRQNASFGDSVSAIVIDNRRMDNSLCTGIVQSTFARNQSVTVPAIAITGMCSPLVVNSVFWDNIPGQLTIDPATGYFANDDVMTMSEIANMQATHSFSLDPMFAPDLSIGDMSPLREAGISGGSGSLFSNGDRDVVGATRIYGMNPDIGAFELQDVIFAHPFDWQINDP